MRRSLFKLMRWRERYLEYFDKDPVAIKKLVQAWHDRNKSKFVKRKNTDSCAIKNGVKGYWRAKE